MSRFSILIGGEPPAILLCTLDLTWAVVPEIFGFVAPERFDFYREHPQRDQFRQETETFPQPNAIWVVTTDAPQTTASCNGPEPCSAAGRCCTSSTWPGCPRRCSSPIPPGWPRRWQGTRSPRCCR